MKLCSKVMAAYAAPMRSGEYGQALDVLVPDEGSDRRLFNAVMVNADDRPCVETGCHS